MSVITSLFQAFDNVQRLRLISIKSVKIKQL